MKRESIKTIEFKNINFVTLKGNVFSDLSFQFPLNDVLWLKGESGSGKSLLTKILCGLVEPTSGEYILNGRSVNEMTFEEFLPLRCNMGYSFEFGGLLNNRTILQNLLLPNEYHNYDFGTPDNLVAHLAEYMQIFGLNKVAHERPSAIIGGLRKSACVARAFVHEPELLLLDDPTTGLSEEIKSRLRDLILRKKAKGEIKHVIVATNDVEFMKALNPLMIEVTADQLQQTHRGQAA